MLNHKFKKKFGQNFISDKNLLNKIVAEADLKENEAVLEIGPGSGNLTEAIFQKTKNITAYEIDEELIEHLNNKFDDSIKIINQDFLKTDLEELKNINQIKVIANLPYYVTTPIIMRLIESNLNIDKMVLMVQKEVAERFTAKPNNRNYNALTVILSYFYNIRIAFTVNKKVFYPIPKVDSAIVVFDKKQLKSAIDINVFKKLVKDSFSQKRKLLKNNITKNEYEILWPYLKELNYNEKVRAENLSLDDFIKLSNVLATLKKVDK